VKDLGTDVFVVDATNANAGGFASNSTLVNSMGGPTRIGRNKNRHDGWFGYMQWGKQT